VAAVVGGASACPQVIFCEQSIDSLHAVDRDDWPAGLGLHCHGVWQ
jgi:hypothetical protein